MEGAEDAKAILLGRTWAYVGPREGLRGVGMGIAVVHGSFIRSPDFNL